MEWSLFHNCNLWLLDCEISCVIRPPTSNQQICGVICTSQHTISATWGCMRPLYLKYFLSHKFAVFTYTDPKWQDMSEVWSLWPFQILLCVCAHVSQNISLPGCLSWSLWACHCLATHRPKPAPLSRWWSWTPCSNFEVSCSTAACHWTPGRGMRKLDVKNIKF